MDAPESWPCPPQRSVLRPVIFFADATSHSDSSFCSLLTALHSKADDDDESSSVSAPLEQRRSRLFSDDLACDEDSSAIAVCLRDRPPLVNFLARRARIVSVSRRHAFPPSKHPRGKAERDEADALTEGILPWGWMDKHARALPSVLVLVATLNFDDQHGEQSAIQAIQDLKLTLAEKRNVPIHFVAILPDSHQREGDQHCHLLRDNISQKCSLPPNRVVFLKYPSDLEPDEWENALLQSPYLATAPPNHTPGDNHNNNHPTLLMMNPLVRQLDRSLRDSSALYYSQLAETHERKLAFWRNRYHTTDASLEVQTLEAAMRCARYSFKAAMMRELQLRTGGCSTFGALLGQPGTITNYTGETGKWTEKGSLAIRLYEEAYRWVVELHRRTVLWRGAMVSSMMMNAPSTPGITDKKPVRVPLDAAKDLASPKFIDSPGGGIGVELSLPTGVNIVSTNPPTIPGEFSQKEGSIATQSTAFYSQLWEQCRAVASIINMKLLRSMSSCSSLDVEQQWRRHRSVFLGNPQGVPYFDSRKNDEFFGPLWHRIAYAVGEMSTMACLAEARWRKDIVVATGNENVPLPMYHQPAAPWKAYSELAEATLCLGIEVQKILRNGSWNDPERNTELVPVGRRRFVGSILTGDCTIGTMKWHFDIESRNDHRAMALEYVLLALDLHQENVSLYQSNRKSDNSTSTETEDTSKTTTAATRLQYFAGRLLMSLNNHARAIPYLRIAANETKLWPSLHLTIQRALLECENKCFTQDEDVSSLPGETVRLATGGLELLLQPEYCRILSDSDIFQAQTYSEQRFSADRVEGSLRSLVWSGDDLGLAKPPLELAVSFLQSTHAISSDSVIACISVKSHLDIPVYVQSLQFNTTAGSFTVPNLEQSVDKSLLHSWFKSETLPIINSIQSSSQKNTNGIQFQPKALAYFFTKIKLPSKLEEVTLGKISLEAAKFNPTNGKLCNMGITHAAGNICKARFHQEKITLDGKPVLLTELSEQSLSFIGGVPLVCHGVTLLLMPNKDVPTNSGSSFKLTLYQKHLLSPLNRSGAQQYLMEECNYMAHSWCRPTHHPWHLGPRCLRVLGPRPLMSVTNLTEPIFNCDAVEGTVNRILFKLQASEDKDCRNIKVGVQGSSRRLKNSEIDDELPSNNESQKLGLDQEPIFVKKSLDDKLKTATVNGISLPQGWEPRHNNIADDLIDSSSIISPFIRAGNFILLPLDIFCPLNSDPTEDEIETYLCTSYEIVLTYRQCHPESSGNTSDQLGDNVTVIQTGRINWVKPFKATFSVAEGPQTIFPCGIQHSSNMLQTAGTQSVLDDQSNIISADGQQVRMRLVLKTNGLGANVAASIKKIVNELELDEHQKELFIPAGSDMFIKQTKPGTKISLSYSVITHRNSSHSNEHVTLPLGVISVTWEPISVSLSPESIPKDSLPTLDEYGIFHGPLCLPNLAPMIIYGPQCKVLNAPFQAKLLKCTSQPKIGVPFHLTYQVKNLTAKTQTLIHSLIENDNKDVTGVSSNSQLLITGKMKGELQIAPFEEKLFCFTLMSMVAGKVHCPSFSVLSGRHQSWIINENVASNKTFYVLP